MKRQNKDIQIFCKEHDKTDSAVSVLSRILAVLFGCIFILSGLAKVLSAVSFSAIVLQYLEMLGLGFLFGAESVFAVTVCSFEIILGFCCFVRRWNPVISWVCLLVIVAFTLITYINYTNPFGSIESCGCLGEIIHFSPAGSFFKNLCLLVLALLFCLFQYINTKPIIREGNDSKDI